MDMRRMVYICGRTRNSPFPPKAKQQKSLSNRGLCQSYFNSGSSSSTSFSDFCLPLPGPAVFDLVYLLRAGISDYMIDSIPICHRDSPSHWVTLG